MANEDRSLSLLTDAINSRLGITERNSKLDKAISDRIGNRVSSRDVAVSTTPPVEVETNSLVEVTDVQAQDTAASLTEDVGVSLKPTVGVEHTPPIGVSVSPEPVDPKKMDNMLQMADDFEMPLSSISENYNLLVSDPSDTPPKYPQPHAQADEFGNVRGQFQVFEPRTMDKIKEWFIGTRPPLPTNPDRIEKVSRVVKNIGTVPIRTALKFAKGMTLNSGDLAWGMVKNIVPDEHWADGVKDMNLDEAMDWAMGYDPSGFAKLTGEVAEFTGRLRTAKGIKTGLTGATPVGLGVIGKATETSIVFGIAATAEQVSKGLAETIDDAEYGFGGKEGIVRDMALGFIFSVATSGVSKFWQALRPTERMRALRTLKLKEGASEEQITQAARKLALKTHPDKVAGKLAEFEKIMQARDLLRKGVETDIVRPGRLKLTTGKTAPVATGEPLTAEATALLKADIKALTLTDTLIERNLPELRAIADSLELKVESLIRFKDSKDFPEFSDALTVAESKLTDVKSKLELATEQLPDEALVEVVAAEPEPTSTLSDKQVDEGISIPSFATAPFRKVASYGHRMHDWLFTFGRAKRLDRPLFDKLMKAFGERNTGIERAVAEVEQAVGKGGITEADAGVLSDFIRDTSTPLPDRLRKQGKKFFDIFGVLRGNLDKWGSAKTSIGAPATLRNILSDKRSRLPDLEAIEAFKTEVETFKESFDGEPKLQDYVDAKLLTESEAGITTVRDIPFDSGKEEDIRIMTINALIDYQKQSTTRSVYDYAVEKGLAIESTPELLAAGWLPAESVGMTNADYKGLVVHPVLGDSLKELQEMQERTGGWVRTLLTSVKLMQFYNPIIVPVYNVMQKAFRGIWSINPITGIKLTAQAVKHVVKKDAKFREYSKLNLYQFPYEMSKGGQQEQVDIMMRRTLADKTVFNHMVTMAERVMGVSFKTPAEKSAVVHDIKKVLQGIYRTLSQATWTADKIQRTQSAMTLERMGYTQEEAANTAAMAHGGYSILSKQYKQAMSPLFFVYSFRILMPLEMSKIALEPAKAILTALRDKQVNFRIPKAGSKKRLLNPNIQRMTKAIIGFYAIPYMVDAYMESRGFEKKGSGFQDIPFIGKALPPVNWKYSKTVTDFVTGEKKEIIVSYNNIINMPLKAFERLSYFNPIKSQARVLQGAERFLKWEIHPVWRVIGMDIIRNKRSIGSNPVYDVNADPLVQAAEIGTYMASQVFRIVDVVLNEEQLGSISKREQEQRDRLIKDSTTRLQKAADIVLTIAGRSGAYVSNTKKQRQAIMANQFKRELGKRIAVIGRQYEGEERDKRVKRLKAWAKKAEVWIKEDLE